MLYTQNLKWWEALLEKKPRTALLLGQTLVIVALAIGWGLDRRDYKTRNHALETKLTSCENSKDEQIKLVREMMDRQISELKTDRDNLRVEISYIRNEIMRKQ